MFFISEHCNKVWSAVCLLVCTAKPSSCLWNVISCCQIDLKYVTAHPDIIIFFNWCKCISFVLILYTYVLYIDIWLICTCQGNMRRLVSFKSGNTEMLVCTKYNGSTFWCCMISVCRPALRDSACHNISQLETMKLPVDMEDGHDAMTIVYWVRRYIWCYYCYCWSGQWPDGWMTEVLTPGVRQEWEFVT